MPIKMFNQDEFSTSTLNMTDENIGDKGGDLNDYAVDVIFI